MHKRKLAYIFPFVFICFFIPALLFALGPDAYKVATLEEEKEKRSPNEIARPAVEFQASKVNNPFIIYAEKAATSPVITVDVVALPSDILLRGIVWGGRFNQAIIKNKIVKVGDSIDGVSILDITPNSVSVFYKGRKFELASPAQEKMQKIQKKMGGKSEK